MALDLSGDLAVFFNTAEFAKTATVAPLAGGASYSLVVIFDRQELWGDPDTGEVQESEPVALAKTADCGSLRDGDTLTVDSQAYRVRARPSADATGITRIMLIKSPKPGP